LDRTNFELVLATAQAGEMLGNKLIYLEGVVALNRQFLEMIDLISKNIEIPIVGGGIVDLLGINKARFWS
jgi:putative glycerol-1-phosphate prenyltransferase